jgi:hypothetical protein
MTDEKSQKDSWDKFKIISTILIPVVLGVAGYFINSSIKEKEIKLKYIEIAVGILQNDPSEDKEGLRLWAIDIIQKQALIPLSQKAIDELKRSALPVDGLNMFDQFGEPILDHKGEPITSK